MTLYIKNNAWDSKGAAKVVKADSAMFGGLPYEKYVHFYFFASPESNASGALEHLNSFVAFAPPGNAATPSTSTASPPRR